MKDAKTMATDVKTMTDAYIYSYEYVCMIMNDVSMKDVSMKDVSMNDDSMNNVKMHNVHLRENFEDVSAFAYPSVPLSPQSAAAILTISPLAGSAAMLMNIDDELDEARKDDTNGEGEMRGKGVRDG